MQNWAFHRRVSRRVSRPAGAFDAAVHVVSMADVRATAGVFGAGGVDGEFVARVEAKAEDAVESVEAVADESDPLRTAVLRGCPSEARLEYRPATAST